MCNFLYEDIFCDSEEEENNFKICDFSRENRHYGYPLNGQNEQLVSSWQTDEKRVDVPIF